MQNYCDNKRPSALFSYIVLWDHYVAGWNPIAPISHRNGFKLFDLVLT